MKIKKFRYVFLTVFAVTSTLIALHGLKYNETVLYTVTLPQDLAVVHDHKLKEVSPDHPAPRQNLWVDLQPNENMLIRRLAYYDDRSGSPTIVLIAMHNDTVQQLKYYAQIVYKTRKLCVPLRKLRSGRLDLKHNLPEIYVNYLLRTDGKLPSEPPLYLRVTSSRWCANEGELSDPILVKYGKNDKLVPFGICLHKALFSITNPQLLVDWIEIHKQLGAEIITVYLEDVPEGIAKAVQSYIKDGLLELLDWNLKKRTRDFGQTGVVNDCLYRNLYRVKYLGMYDLDEVIVSQKHYSWHEMIEYLNSRYNLDKYASLSFKGCPFHVSTRNKVIGNNVSLCQNASLPVYFRWTMRDKDAVDHPKLMIKPALIISAHIHHIDYAWTTWFSFHINVPAKLAICHHYNIYRKPKDTFYSNIMARYERPLLEGIKKRICHVSMKKE